MSDTEYTPTTGTFGHGCIVLTHYPSSQRVGVVQTGQNAVMDSWELVEFVREAGLLAAHDREIAAHAHDVGYRQGVRDVSGEEYTGPIVSQYRTVEEARE